MVQSISRVNAWGSIIDTSKEPFKNSKHDVCGTNTSTKSPCSLTFRKMDRSRMAARLTHRPPSHRLHNARRFLHTFHTNSSALLQSYVPSNIRRNKKHTWPFGSYSLHNIPPVRAISFARVMPKLAVKLARIPAMFGTAMIAGLAYLQYQATRKLSESNKTDQRD